MRSNADTNIQNKPRQNLHYNFYLNNGQKLWQTVNKIGHTITQIAENTKDKNTISKYSNENL